MGNPLSVAGLFAGIAGIELGLHQTGHESRLLCEIEPAAKRILLRHFPDIPLVGDIRGLKVLPKVDLVAAGFPCQDLSQAGCTAGIRGKHSSLVAEVFRLVTGMKTAPRWLFLENVPFMLQLQSGKAMHYLVDSLEELGYAWAYRVVDARAFGLPQRRQRVLLLASKTEDPRDVLFQGREDEPDDPQPGGVACGFYWTEGMRGLGWAVDAVPTLKGGSTVGIPSPPAIRMPMDRAIVLPDIRDAERLQGFPADWTLPALTETAGRHGPRWRLVGNALSVPLSKWLGERLHRPERYSDAADAPITNGDPWPKAAWGRAGKAYRADVPTWPTVCKYHHLATFLRFPTRPLSARATSGFFNRTKISSLRFPPGFLDDVAAHLERMSTAVA